MKVHPIVSGHTSRSISTDLEVDRLDGGYSSSSRDTSVDLENNYRQVSLTFRNALTRVWTQMWIEKREENDQLIKDIETARKELKSKRIKLEEALVVRNWCNILTLWKLNIQILCWNWTFKSMLKLNIQIYVEIEHQNLFQTGTRFLATLLLFSRPDRSQTLPNREASCMKTDVFSTLFGGGGG